MILNNGTYNGHRILSQWAVDQIFVNYNARFGEGYGHGLGFELDQYYTAGPMASLTTASHTGYTGTTLAIDRGSSTFFLHFANRVHPSREWSSNNLAREASLGCTPEHRGPRRIRHDLLYIHYMLHTMQLST